MNEQPAQYTFAPLLPFDQPQPRSKRVREKKPAPAVIAVELRETGPQTEAAGKRTGYQISARETSKPDDPGTCTYTEAVDEQSALMRAREEFPPDEGWIDHEAKEIGRAD
jgi:hypothetical protein